MDQWKRVGAGWESMELDSTSLDRTRLDRVGWHRVVLERAGRDGRRKERDKTTRKGARHNVTL